MKKLIAWLNKNNYSHKPAFYSGNYFYNVPEIRKEAAEITILSNKIKEVTKQADKLRKYASRYNYTVMHESRLNCTYYGEYYITLFLLPDKDAAALEHYYFYQDAAAAECELLMHEYHEAGKYQTHAAELNTLLRAIMDNYGAMYNRSFIKISAA